MSELGETFHALREESKERRATNKDRSIQVLLDNKINFKMLSSDHIRVGEFDYWPSTGLFIHMKNKKKGRGVFNLLKALGVK